MWGKASSLGIIFQKKKIEKHLTLCLLSCCYIMIVRAEL